MPSSLTLLHLSDLQFGKNHAFGKEGGGKDWSAPASLLQRLIEDLASLKKDFAVAPEVVVVTGDLTEWALPSEFGQLETFLDGLAKYLGLPRARVLVVPGNHDINRAHCEAYFLEAKGSETKTEYPYWPKWKNYAQFLTRFYGDTAFSPQQPWVLHRLDDLKLVVAGLNSTLDESHRDEDHHGKLKEDQLRWFQKALEPYQTPDWFRLGLVHHNPFRGAQNDDENLHDTADLKRILGSSFNLVLHGHTHQTTVEWLGPACPVLSTGSAGVVAGARPLDNPNQYQVLKLSPGELWVGRRAYAVSEKRFIGDPRATQAGHQFCESLEVRWRNCPYLPPPGVRVVIEGLGPPTTHWVDPNQTVGQFIAQLGGGVLDYQMRNDWFEMASDRPLSQYIGWPRWRWSRG